MPKIFTSQTQKTGEIGEDLACKFLEKGGFSVIGRNYTKKWGELDIVAEKDNKIHFVEVKSVTRVTSEVGVTRVTNQDEYRPEENVHPGKIKRLHRAIQTYLLERKIKDNQEWQLDIAVVLLNLKDKTARVSLIEDIVA